MLCFCTVSSTSVPITVTTETAKELGTSSTRINHTLQIHLFFRVAHLESPVILQQNSKEKCTFCAEEKNPIYKTKYLKKCPNNYDPKCLGMAI